MADAVVAVSEGTKSDILQHFNVPPEKIHVIYNGIDTEEYKPVDPTPALKKYGPARGQALRPLRRAHHRQKGIVHLVEAIKHMHEGYDVVLCAGAPDTKEIAAEMEAPSPRRARGAGGIHWIQKMVDKTDVIQLYSGAAVFCCPSIYEPFGIINLEAMACETPVVGSMVGGIPEVVVHDEETGFLVPVAQQRESPFAPLHPADYARTSPRHQPPDGGPRQARALREGRSRARRRAVQLGEHRRADARPLRLPEGLISVALRVLASSARRRTGTSFPASIGLDATWLASGTATGAASTCHGAAVVMSADVGATGDLPDVVAICAVRQTQERIHDRARTSRRRTGPPGPRSIATRSWTRCPNEPMTT